MGNSYFKVFPCSPVQLGGGIAIPPTRKIALTFFKLNIFCSNFQDRQISRWNVRIRGLFVQKYLGGVPDKMEDLRFLKSWIFLKFLENYYKSIGFHAPNPVILLSFSSLLSFSVIRSEYPSVINHFGSNILLKLQLLSKTRTTAVRPARSSFNT